MDTRQDLRHGDRRLPSLLLAQNRETYTARWEDIRVVETLFEFSNGGLGGVILTKLQSEVVVTALPIRLCLTGNDAGPLEEICLTCGLMCVVDDDDDMDMDVVA